MTQRFICPHCHASVEPARMERALSELAEYRICPGCDEAVFFALREQPVIPPWLRRGRLQASTPESGDKSERAEASAAR